MRPGDPKPLLPATPVTHLPRIERQGRKLFLLDASGTRWRILAAYRPPPDWKLTTRVPKWVKNPARLFIRDDGLLRCYDPASFGFTHQYEPLDWSATTLQWQLALANPVRPETDRPREERAKRDQG